MTARTGRPIGRPRLAFKVCPYGHDIRRLPSDHWPMGCPQCRQERLAEKYEAYRQSPEAAAFKEKRRLATVERKRQFRATPQGRVYGREQKSRRRATPEGRAALDRWNNSVTGQLSNAITRLQRNIRHKEARVTELEGMITIG